jgi:condensin complex subunit 1
MTRSLVAPMQVRGMETTAKMVTRVENRLLLDQRKRKRSHGAVVVSCQSELLISVNRHQNEEAEDAMDVDEEDEEVDEVDSIIDEDESEPSEVAEGEGEGDGEEGTSSSKDKSKGKKDGRKPELDMAALTDEQAALAALESNQLLHLRLRKRYYSEALNFIRQVEEAAQMIFQLLGSTHKTEVLESMEFFRVAHEYQLDSAEVRLSQNVFGYFEAGCC